VRWTGGWNGLGSKDEEDEKERGWWKGRELLGSIGAERGRKSEVLEGGWVGGIEGPDL